MSVLIAILLNFAAGCAVGVAFAFPIAHKWNPLTAFPLSVVLCLGIITVAVLATRGHWFVP